MTTQQMEKRTGVIVTKATVKIQALVRGKLERKHFAVQVYDLRRRRDKTRWRKQQEESE